MFWRMVTTTQACTLLSPGQAKADPTKFSGKKSKAAAKKGPGATQWQILKQSGIPEGEIPDFRLAHCACLLLASFGGMFLACQPIAHIQHTPWAGTLHTGFATSRRWRSATCARWAVASTGAARSSQPT